MIDGERIRVMRIIARMNVGGPALQASVLMRGLDRELFDQRLYTGTVEPGEADYLELRARDVTPHRIATLGRSIRPADDARAVASLVAEMRRFRPHIVHTHTAKAGLLGRTAAVLARVPARVHTYHGHLLYGYFSPAKTQLVVHSERMSARLCDRLVAVGTRVRDELIGAGIGRAEQYAVVPPGTELRPPPARAAARLALGLPGDGPVVAFVGRLTGVKRPDRLVEVARELRRLVPGVRFVICGSGDAAGEVAAAAPEFDGAMRMVGWRRDVETVYGAADLVLLTSDNEGMPVSLIEAALSGLPVVATRVGSVAEVVHDGVTGLLAPCDAGTLARRAAGLLLDDPRRREMGRRARAWATQRFGAERLVADITGIYGSIAEERGWWPVRQKEEAR
ncbi:glycosyltransferase [Actinoallomurus iriomotensis]|uniref:Glycosyl transferase n=1 Tax=Actinoallomurus iriomotensis TaxID=478107 RepID=A0A9W6RVK1_9ACTN|nr:glycosyltransferase [Actinoallomurus iriomotensis]GLY80695.1 glycosyl transferase [Actinoallomurus iriomotensis]